MAISHGVNCLLNTARESARVATYHTWSNRRYLSPTLQRSHVLVRSSLSYLLIDTSRSTGTDIATVVLVSAVGAFLAILVAGEIFLSTRSKKVSRSIRRFNEQPVRSLLVGLLPFGGGVGLVVLLPSPGAPMLFTAGASLVWAVGAAVAVFQYCRAGRRTEGRFNETTARRRSTRWRTRSDRTRTHHRVRYRGRRNRSNTENRSSS